MSDIPKNSRWKKSFFTIVLGQAVSLIGSSGVQFALIWWLAEQTSSPLIMGIAGIAAFLPMTLLSPFAGVAADRYSRKAICIASDMSAGILALIYAILLYFADLPVSSVLLVLFLRGIGGTFQQPAMQAIIPQLVPQDQLMKANGWIQLISSGSFILGPVVGALLYASVSMSVLLLTDVIGAVFACATLAAVKIPKLKNPPSESAAFRAQFREGLLIYREDPQLLRLIVAQGLCMLFYTPLSSFYPLMTSDYFALSALHGSIVETGFALGMMISAFLFSSVLRVKHKIAAAYVGLFGIGATTLICGLLPPVFTGWLIFAAVCSFMGAFSNVHMIPLTSYMQETIAPEKMGRAFSLLTLIGSLSMPLGLLFSSPVAERLGVHTWFLISGIFMLAICTLISLTSRRPARPQPQSSPQHDDPRSQPQDGPRYDDPRPQSQDGPRYDDPRPQSQDGPRHDDPRSQSQDGPRQND